MIPSLRSLIGLISPERPAPSHDQLEHAHWDPLTRTWRSHAGPEESEQSA